MIIDIKEFFDYDKNNLKITLNYFYNNFCYDLFSKDSELNFVYTKFNNNEIKHNLLNFKPNIFLINNENYKIYVKLTNEYLIDQIKKLKKLYNFFIMDNNKNKIKIDLYQEKYQKHSDNIIKFIKNRNVNYATSLVRKNKKTYLLLDSFQFEENLHPCFYIDFFGLYYDNENIDKKHEILNNFIFLDEEDAFYFKLKFD